MAFGDGVAACISTILERRGLPSVSKEQFAKEFGGTQGNSKTFRFSLDAPESSPNSIMTRLRIPLLFQYMPISELDANQFIEFLEDFEKGVKMRPWLECGCQVGSRGDLFGDGRPFLPRLQQP
uniref:Uncharacterized protein n=1 Tax=Guillardia theta TaxID=55529 RepID=A0A7S4NYI9_GUITH